VGVSTSGLTSRLGVSAHHNNRSINSFLEIIAESPVALISGRPGVEPEDYDFPCRPERFYDYSESLLGRHVLKNIRDDRPK
jgi:hypothetical protein